jgi:hypothetical protein
MGNNIKKENGQEWRQGRKQKKCCEEMGKKQFIRSKIIIIILGKIRENEGNIETRKMKKMR